MSFLIAFDRCVSPGGFTGGDPTCAQVHGNASTNDPSKHVAMTTLAETEAVSASTPHVPPKQVEVSLMDVPSSKKAPLTRAQRRVIGGILVGDFMHNFVDGVFIASAFKSCGTSFGWSLTAATIAHELTQVCCVVLMWLTDCAKGGHVNENQQHFSLEAKLMSYFTPSPPLLYTTNKVHCVICTCMV